MNDNEWVEWQPNELRREEDDDDEGNNFDVNFNKYTQFHSTKCTIARLRSVGMTWARWKL